MKRKSIHLSIALTLVLILLFANLPSVMATINGYLGSGKFSTGNLNWCHAGSSWAAECQNAVARWSYDTDLNMYSNCSTIHIWTVYAYYGSTGWAGYAYICGGGQCNNSTAWNSTYTSCDARLNRTYIEANPGFYTSAEVQKLATHELGHCYSLDHASVSGSVMKDGSVPNSQDINLVNARY